MSRILLLIIKTLFEESIKFFVVLSLSEYIKVYFAKNKNEKDDHGERMKRVMGMGLQIILMGLAIGTIAITSYQFGKLAERKRWCDSYPFVEKCNSIPDVIFERKK